VAPSIEWYCTHEEQSIVNGLHLAPSIEWYATLKEQSIVNALLLKSTGSPTVELSTVAYSFSIFKIRLEK